MSIRSSLTHDVFHLIKDRCSKINHVNVYLSVACKKNERFVMIRQLAGAMLQFRFRRDGGMAGNCVKTNGDIFQQRE